MLTTPALTTPFIALMAAAAWMSPRPALAGPQAVGPEAAPAARQVFSLPESPAAAFERLLAVRTPTPSAAVAPKGIDPLPPYFQAALWGTQAQSTFQTAVAGQSREVRK
jgi:hypothetical protein